MAKRHILLLLLAIALMEFALARRSVKSSKALSLPPWGYMRATTSQSKPNLLIKTVRRVSQQIFCSALKFVNIPVPNSSPLMGPNYFQLKNSTLDGRLVYSNGKEYLSYIGDDNYGTWLIGNHPGVDSGFVYLKPTIESLGPLGLESIETKWHWLQNGKWAPQNQTYLECIGEDPIQDQDESVSTSLLDTFHIVEVMDKETKESKKTILVTITKQIPLSKYFKIELSSEATSLTSKYLLFWSAFGTWVSISNIDSLHAMGDPYMITYGDRNPVLGYLVNEELSGDGWRWTFRCINSITDDEDNLNNFIGVTDDLHPQDRYTLEESQGQERLNDLNAYVAARRSDELLVEFDYNGVGSGFKVQRLSLAQRDDHWKRTRAALTDSQIGDYVWIWYSNMASNSSRANSAHASTVDQMLLECVYASDSLFVFRYYLSDRIDTMHETVLNRDTQYIVLNASLQSLDNIVLEYFGKNLRVHSAMHIGPKPVDYILSYLYHKETTLGNLPSCFLYHAAVSLPRPLVYAAEILCVLLGAKPITMIQYTTPSDHQWKFPLVQQLVQGISVAKIVFGDRLDVEMETFQYFKDQSLIIYRTGRRYLAHSLQPFGQAQALHPAPYPDDSRVTDDWKLQIYYAWWNGFVLGYPSYFVDSYCETFHNGLELSDKARAVAEAKIDVQNYFDVMESYDPKTQSCDAKSMKCHLTKQIDKADMKNIEKIVTSKNNRESGLSPVLIGFGTDYPVIEDIWGFIRYKA